MLEQDILINSDNKRLEIDIMEIPTNCVIVISNGKAKLRELQPHGDYKIVTHAGRVSRMRREDIEEDRVLDALKIHIIAGTIEEIEEGIYRKL